MEQVSSQPPNARRAVLVVMCAGMFLILFDVTSVNVTLPSIATSLSASTAGLQWVVDGYAVAIASLLLAGGTVGDRIGHRRVVLCGFTLFGLASLVIGCAPNIAVLVAGRVAQGVGAALLLPGTLAVITTTYPERVEQARAIGTWAAVSSLALPAGPIVGGVLATVSWRAIFLVNLPVTAMAVAYVLRLVPGGGGRPRELDIGGVCGVTVTLAGTVFGVIELGREGMSPPALGAFVVAAVAAGVTVVVERRAAVPMLPLALVRRAAFLGPNTVALTMNLVFNGTLFVTTLYLQDVRGCSPLVAGALVLPLAVPLVALAPVTSRLTGWLGPRVPVTAGCLVALPGAALLILVTRQGSLLPLEAGMLLMGCGAGMITASVVAAAVRAVPPERSGFASGVNNTARQAGTALGVAIFGAVAGSGRGGAHLTRAFNHLGALSCLLWVVAAAVAAVTISGGAASERS